MWADDASPNPSVAVPSIIALPEPVTAPLIVMFPPWAQINPQFATSLFTISPPLPVASSVPALVTTLVPVSMTRAWRPVATMVLSLTSVICPAPSWPAPEIVLSTLVSVTLGMVPEMKFCPLSDSISSPPPWSAIPYWMSCSASGRIERDGSRVVDDTAEWQQRAVADRHGAGIVQHRRLIEDEVARRERSRGHPEERDRLAGPQPDHRVAGIVLGQM